MRNNVNRTTMIVIGIGLAINIVAFAFTRDIVNLVLIALLGMNLLVIRKRQQTMAQLRDET